MSVMENASRYYRDKGISPLAFKCKHRDDCKRDCTTFTEAHEPYIGREYERCGHGSIPRLLFLSLDSGTLPPDPMARTAQAQQTLEENRSNHGPNPHWRYTHELAQTLLKQFKQGLSFQEACRYFAHTNSAKCSMNNLNNKMAGRQLFENCREYIPGEIEVLKPDILVTQGDWAMEAITRNFSATIKGEQKSCGYAFLKLGDHNLLWFHSYHPTNYGKFFRQKKSCWPQWEVIVGEFWSGQLQK